MSLATHIHYKDSGVVWLGKVPNDWEISQSRRLFALRNERANSEDEQLTASQEHSVIPQKMFMELEGRSVVQVILNAEILKHVEPGDFVISMRSFQGGIEYATNGGCISSAYVMLIPSRKVHGPFFKYLFKSQTYIQALQSTTNLVRDGQALRYQIFTLVDLPMVPLPEQRAIASFLDVETSKIDGLVSEQCRLIELLKEKRQVVISHAVTKGLNPNAPMKPSGIEWLGDVPKHWAVSSLRYFATFYTGSTPARDYPEFWNGDIPWVKTGEIKYNLITETEESITQEGLDSSSYCVAPTGTMLMALYGQGVTRGRVAILGIPAAFNQACVAITVDDRLSNAFLHTFFVFAYSHIRDIGNETTQMNMNVEFVRRIRIVVPPMDEQVSIAELVTVECQRFDSLEAEAERAIELLQERRTALISAAVTGKIDVRGFVSKEAVA